MGIFTEENLSVIYLLKGILQTKFC